MNKTLNSLAHKKLTYIFNHSVDSNESSEAYYYYDDDGSFTLVEKAYWNNNTYNIDWKVSISIKSDQFIIFPKKKIKLYFENCDKDFKTNIYSFNNAILYIDFEIILDSLGVTYIKSLHFGKLHSRENKLRNTDSEFKLRVNMGNKL
jgi:hypothetical protein